MDLKQRAVKSVAWVGSIRMIIQFFSWMVTILMVRILTPEDFGLMGMVYAYQGIIILIYDLSLGEAIIQKKKLTDIDINSVFWFTSIFGVCLTIFSYLISPWVAAFFQNNQLIELIRIASLGFIFLSLKEVPMVLVSRNLDFAKRSKSQMVAGFVQMGSGLFLALQGYGALSLVIGLLLNYVVYAVMISYYAGWHPQFIFSLNSLFEMMRFALPLLCSNIIDYFNKKSDAIVIGRYLGDTTLGYYQVAMDLSRIPINKFVAIINQVCLPVFSILQDNMEELRAYFFKVIKYISIFSFPMFLGIFILARDIILIVLTPKWLPALILLRIFCIVSIMMVFTGTFNCILKARGRVDVVFKISILTLIFMPPAFFFTVDYGVESIALVWIFIYPLIFAYFFYQVLKELRMSMVLFLKGLLPALIGSLAMMFSVFVFHHFILTGQVSILNLILQIGVGAVVYLLYFIFFQRSTVHEAINLVKMSIA